MNEAMIKDGDRMCNNIISNPGNLYDIKNDKASNLSDTVIMKHLTYDTVMMRHLTNMTVMKHRMLVRPRASVALQYC